MINLEKMKNVSLDTVTPSSLVDIQQVQVDKNLPRDKRIAEFVRQIGNPYCFRCGDFIVKASYAEDGATLEECLQSLML